MAHGKKKFYPSREAPNGPPLGLVIALAAAGGMVFGSAGTYFFSKTRQSGSPAAGGTPQAQTVSMAPQQGYTPAPQPPGEAPPGKVWSVEHGHWHDAPVVTTIPAPATATPAPETVGPDPATVTPAATTAPAPAAAPAEKPTAAPAEKKE